MCDLQVLVVHEDEDYPDEWWTPTGYQCEFLVDMLESHMIILYPDERTVFDLMLSGF